MSTDSLVVVTFASPGIGQWPVFIRKEEWSKEIEESRILEQIKTLKTGMIRRYREYFFELTKTQANILYSLAIDGPCHSEYELEGREIEGKEIGDDTTVRNSIPFLESNYLIRTEEARTRRHQKRIELTTAGLFRLLCSEWQELWSQLDKIATNNGAKVPLIFGLWKEFLPETITDFKQGILQYFQDPEHFYIAAFDYLVRRRPGKFSERLLAEDLTRHLVLPQLFEYVYEFFLPGFYDYLTVPFEPRGNKKITYSSTKTMELWIKGIARYPQLRKYLSRELRRLERVGEHFAFAVREWRKMLPPSSI
jgi:hypothetical protein